MKHKTLLLTVITLQVGLILAPLWWWAINGMSPEVGVAWVLTNAVTASITAITVIFNA